MGWFKCLECGSVFQDPEKRPSVLEDGMNPWDDVSICPVCKSEELDDLYNCIRCDEPIIDGARSVFCDDCRKVIDGAFRRAIDEVSSDKPMDYLDVVKLMFERAEECNFYE